jgi:hypothetical protein
MAFFGGSSFGGLFGGAQQTQQTQIIGISSSLLAASVDAKITQRTLASLSAADRASLSASSDRGDAVIAPWQVDSEEQSLNERIREVRELTQFIDLDDSDLEAVKDDPDSQATFAVFKALERLRVLAEYASEDSTSTSSLERLDELFQSGLDEVRDYISTAELEKLELFLGDKEYNTEASTRGGKNGTEFNTSLVTSDPNEAIAGLTGTEVCTVSITKNGETDDIEIDLSGISGPLSLNNIADHINAQIEALTALDDEGEEYIKHGTRFDVRRDGTSGRYGLQIEGTLTEEVKLSAASAEPTLYVASAVSQLDDEYAVTSRITELNNLSGTITVDDTTSFAAIDYEATAIKELVDDTEDEELDENIKSLRDKFLADSAEEVAAASDDDDDSDDDDLDTDNESSLTNVNSDYKVNADTTAGRVAVDSEGGIYVVGTSQGSFGHQLNAASDQDVFLTKFDSEGNVVFSRLLGASDSAKVHGITVDSDDNVIIVGETNSALTENDIVDADETLNTGDAYVVKYSKNGDEQFRYQLDTYGASSAYSVAVDSNNDIYVGGYTRSAISSTSGFSGGQDALILKLSGDSGKLTDSNVFGSSDNEVIKGIAVDADDNLVVATESDGNAVVYRIDGADLSSQTASVDLGSLGAGGAINSIAIHATNNQVYIAGKTSNSNLNASGAATVNETAQGGFEGFVSGFSYSGTSTLNADFTTYLSSAGADYIADVVVQDQVVYVAGSATDTIGGENAAGATDAFVARLDGASGALEDVEVYGEGLARSNVGGLAFTTQGDSVLETLGLPTGTIAIDETLDVQTQTSARVGDFFYVSIDGGTKKKIELEDGDTFDDLKRKLRIAGFGKMEVDVTTTSEGDKLKISALDDGVSIDLLPGTGGQDLLERIGLDAGRLLPKNEVFDLGDDEDIPPEEDLGGVFSLGLGGALHIRDKATAKYVLGLLDSAIGTTQRAFRSLTFDPIKAQLLADSSNSGGEVPPHLQNQIANFQTGLARLQSGSSSPALNLFA